jgi:tRNA(adenine34) deaminase
MSLDDRDRRHLKEALRLALEAEQAGNMPIGSVIAIEDEVIGAAGNALLVPEYNPGRHAEIEAIATVKPSLWSRAAEMTCYSTLEPCIMCTGTLILHGVGRVVFGALDAEGGGRFVLEHLPPYYRNTPIRWEGPAMPEVCQPLYLRALAQFEDLPCARRHAVE